MSIFPAQYSTLSAIALNSYLKHRYTLTGPACNLLIRNVSDTYVVTDGPSKYIFKIYRNAHRKIEEIKGEVELLTALQQHDARISYPVPDSEGEYLQRFEAAEGIRYGVLFSWADGEVVYALSDEQLRIAGREMARIHQISSGVKLKNYRKPYSVETTLTEPLIRLQKAFMGLEAEYAWLVAATESVKANMATYDLSFFSRGYCHFDFFPKNFHFTKSNHITFFDFDFAGEGLLAYDITSFFIHYFLEVTYGKITVEAARRAFQTFLNSYRESRAINDREIAAIPDLGFAFWLFYLNFQFENYDDWSNFFFNQKFIKDRVALIKKWMETAGGLLP